MTPNALPMSLGSLTPLARVRVLPQAPHRASRAPASAAPTAAQRGSYVAPLRTRERSKRAQPFEFRLIYAALFAIFVFTSALERLIPGVAKASVGASGEAHKSIFDQAREAASISAGYAFMG